MKNTVENSADRNNHSYRSDLKEKAETLRTDISEIAQIASKAAQEKVAELQRTAGDQTEQLGRYISKDPLRSVLIACGLGFTLGLLLRRS